MYGKEIMANQIQESWAMRIAGLLGLRRIRWSLRRLHVPVHAKALVLEVGSGGNPYPRANVLLDGFEDSSERIEKKLVRDRPFVFGLCEKLPFRDKVFDFVICSHVLEHTDDPVGFLSELQRVAKAGYIETPDGFFERINPYTYHRLEITTENHKLLIKKKKKWKDDPEVVDLYERKLKKDCSFQYYIRTFPDSFYVRFYWEDEIEYHIVNPKDSASWSYPKEINTSSPTINKLKDVLRSACLFFFKTIFSQNRRNATINLVELLHCVKCNNDKLIKDGDTILCNKCQQRYFIVDGVPKMIEEEISGANQVRSRSVRSGENKN